MIVQFTTIELITFILKCVSFVFVILYSLDSIIHYHSTHDFLEKNIFYFYIWYGFYIFIISLNSLYKPIFRNAGLGIATFGLTFGNLRMFNFSMEVFYRGNYRKDPKIQRFKISYVIIGIISSFIYTWAVYSFHGYEDQDITLPWYLFILTPPLILSYLYIYVSLFLKVLKLDIQRNNFTEEILPYQMRNILHRKALRVELGLISFIFMITFNYIDSFFSNRTVLSIFGWIFMILGLFLIHIGYYTRKTKTERLD